LATSSVGRLSARLQNGQMQTYSLAAVIGLVIIAAAIVGRRFLP
jgi:NADH-quinone oxidoreductase subunit L